MDVGRSAVFVVVDVVGVAPRHRGVAAGEDAAAVADGQGSALGGGASGRCVHAEGHASEAGRGDHGGDGRVAQQVPVGSGR